MTAENEISIDSPRLWRMALQLSPLAVDVVLSSLVADATLRQFSITLNPSQPYLKVVEDAIYSTPEILGDYGHIDIVLRTDSYVTVPREFSDDEALACGRYAQLDNNSERALELSVDSTDCAKIVWAMDSDLRNFLARTFRNAPLQCHITPLLHYLSRQSHLGNSSKLYAHFSGDRVDILAFAANGALSLAVTHTVLSDTDALYFIMACARQAGLNVMNDEILLCGDPSRRIALMPLISRYAARVMPLIFPSAALRAGREAFNAPFPLILIPLCE